MILLNRGGIAKAGSVLIPICYKQEAPTEPGFDYCFCFYKQVAPTERGCTIFVLNKQVAPAERMMLLNLPDIKTVQAVVPYQDYQQVLCP